MTPPTLYRQRIERFARLLEDGPESGEHRPHLSAADAGLVALGRRVATINAPGDVDSDFRTNLRAMLVAAAERVGEERPATLPATEPVGVRERLAARLAKAHTLLGSTTESQRARARGAIIAGVAAGAIAVSGISTASEDSMPGDALYGMKRSAERAQLALAGTDVSKGELLLEFAWVRLGEAEAVRGDSAAFARLLAETNEDTTQGVSLLTKAAVENAQAKPLDTVARFVARQQPNLTSLLDGPTSDTERVTASLGLLDRVSARIEDLRKTLPCGPGAAGATDELGPRPAGCTTGTGSTDKPRKRRTANRVTAMAGYEPDRGVGGGTIGSARVRTDQIPGLLGTTFSPPGKSRDPQAKPPKSHRWPGT